MIPSSPAGFEPGPPFATSVGSAAVPGAPASSPGHRAAPADLLQAALAVRQRAHAPYSRFQVGAALRSADGRIFTGANVENAAYGLSICAERSALVAAVSAGVAPGGFAEMAVVGDTPRPIAPCGACRQVMLELGGASLPVWLSNTRGAIRETTAGGLLPHAFDPADLGA